MAQIGQAVREGPKYIAQFEGKRLTKQILPVDGRLQLHAYPQAIFDREHAWQFWLTQSFLFAVFLFFFFVLGRAKVLPRRSAECWLLLYAVSLYARFH